MANPGITPSRKRPWRIVLSIILLIAVSAGSWLALEWWRMRRELGSLDAEIAKRRAAGEPVLFEDFKRPTIPDDQNAAVFLQCAKSRMRFKADDDNITVDRDDRTTAGQASLQRASSIVAADHAALADIRRARGCRNILWDVQSVKEPLPRLNWLRNMSSLLKLAILCDIAEDDGASAIEYLQDLLFLSHAADTQGSLPPHLTAVGLTLVTCDLIERIAPDLIVAEAPASVTQPASPHPATKEQVCALIAQLLDEQDRRQHIISTWQYEVMEYVGLDLDAAVGEASWRGRTRFYRCAAWTMRMCDISREASLQTAWGKMRKVLAMMPKPPEDAGDRLADKRVDAFTGTCAHEIRTLAERRAAAINLAMRLYAAEHQGQLPPKLADLVPKYIDSLPADPMSGNDFIYRPGPRPILYSVGEDGKDDGGDETRPANAQNLNRWAARDAVFHLAKQRPTTAPTTSISR